MTKNVEEIKPLVTTIVKEENKPSVMLSERTEAVLTTSTIKYSQSNITYSQASIQYGGVTGSTGGKPIL